MALINNLISSLGSKDPNKKLLSNVNDGQTTSTMEGQGFSDSQYDSMASDFAFDMQNKAFDASKELKTEYDYVDKVRSESARIGKEGANFNETNHPYFTENGIKSELNPVSFYKRMGMDTKNLTLNDSLLSKEKQQMLMNDFSTPTGSGASCNTYSCELQQRGNAKAPEDFTYTRKVDGKRINVKAGDLIPTFFNNEEFDRLAPSFGYEHVQRKDANQVHETGMNQKYAPGTNSAYNVFNDGVYDGEEPSSYYPQFLSGKKAANEYIKNIREVDEIIPGDIYRGGFNPTFNSNNNEMNSRVAHSMTAGGINSDGKREFYSNPGRMESGLKTVTTSRQNA